MARTKVQTGSQADLTAEMIVVVVVETVEVEIVAEIGEAVVITVAVAEEDKNCVRFRMM